RARCSASIFGHCCPEAPEKFARSFLTRTPPEPLAKAKFRGGSWTDGKNDWGTQPPARSQFTHQAFGSWPQAHRRYREPPLPTISSNLVGCSTGISEGFAPLRILATIAPSCSHIAGRLGP